MSLSNLGNAYQALNEETVPFRNNFLKRVGNAYGNVNEGFNVPKGNLLGLNEPIVRQETPINANLANVLAPLAKFDAGIFLDNEPTYRTQVKNACLGKFITPYVPETKGYVANFSVVKQGYLDFLELLSDKGQDAAKVLSRLCLLLGGKVEAYDEKAGINEETIQEILSWVDTHENKRLVAVFDFDRTLTKMEGGFFVGNGIQEMKKNLFEMEEYHKTGTNPLTGEPQYHIVFSYQLPSRAIRKIPIEQGLSMRPYLGGLTAEGFVNYLAGGTARLTMIQEMFDYLYSHNVKIVVLTNNDACLYRPILFQEFMNVFTRNRPVEILCGRDPAYGGNKGYAMIGKPTSTGVHKAIRQMCISAGGKQYRKKTKKRGTKRRQTKRR
jgi:hypothetical protein